MAVGADPPPMAAGDLPPGLRNRGLLSHHVLASAVPDRDDWSAAGEADRAVRDRTGLDLLEGLGYDAEPIDDRRYVLTDAADGREVAVAVVGADGRFGDDAGSFDPERTPVVAALAAADGRGLDYVIACAGGQLRLHATDPDAGFGPQGRAGTYVEADADRLADDAPLRLLFSASALGEGESLERLRRASRDRAAALGERLRERAGDVVGDLAAAIAAERDLAGEQGFAAGVAARRDSAVDGAAERHFDADGGVERNPPGPTRDQLDGTRRMALVALFRLLFVAYAEAEGLLPVEDPRYAPHSLTRTVRELCDRCREVGGDGGQAGGAEGLAVELDSDSTALWDDAMALVRAVHDGRAEWGLPACGGRLLSPDPDDVSTAGTEPVDVPAAGARLADVALTDDQFGPVLVGLLGPEMGGETAGNGEAGPADGEGSAGPEPLDLRDVDVRAMGRVYEGLVATELSVARQPLTVDGDGRYVPVDGVGGGAAGGGRDGDGRADRSDGPADGGGDRDDVAVAAGEVYLHGRSGERKATGTYYTEPRFVAHLLDHAVEPALDDHVERIERLLESDGERAAADAFFDVRVADVAMGSGHFLLAAVDRVTRRLSGLLVRHDLPSVEAELDRLREVAVQRRGVDDGASEPDGQPRGVPRTQLLRHQVARRCVHGVDADPLATELARASLWLHTAVPGLVPTAFEHNLRTGDSLAGVGTLAEAADLLNERDGSGATVADLRDAISEAGRLVEDRAAAAADPAATRGAVDRRLERARAALDGLAASRLGDERDADAQPDADLVHFPVAFPAAFVGEEPGFDAVVGNPPWEEAVLEEDEFWARYVPGLQARDQGDQERIKRALRERRPDLVAAYEAERDRQQRRRELLRAGPYPGMGTGDPDTYKAFAWRFWRLARRGGHVGLVLPRSALVAAGSEPFRRTILEDGTVRDVTLLKNEGGWVFDGVTEQYTVALLAVQRSPPGDDATLPLRGPFTGPESYEAGMDREPHRFDVERALGWTASASLPKLPPDPDAVAAFEQLSDHSPLGLDDPDAWRARPHAELHATNDKTAADGTEVMRFPDDPPDDYWPVYRGGSFRLWEPDTGTRYAWADPDVAIPYLQAQRERSYRYAGSRSAFAAFDEAWVHDEGTLPCLSPRVAFRDVARASDPRTVVAALVPPETLLTNKAPYLLFPRGDAADEAYVLGVVCSLPFDWYARRFVEMGVNYHLLESIPVPRPGRDDPLRRRVVALAGRLAAVDGRYADWADAASVDCGPLDGDGKRARIHELDAVVARLYGLSREHLEAVYATFHDGWDHEQRLDAVLAHYDDWDREHAATSRVSGPP